MKGLTAAELEKLCGRTENCIYSYESDITFPHYTIMEKICVALGVPVQYFNDDYYNFVLSEDYTSFLREWRKKNTKRHYDVKKMLGVSFAAYFEWEQGKRMSRKTFEKIRKKLGI